MIMKVVVREYLKQKSILKRIIFEKRNESNNEYKERIFKLEKYFKKIILKEK